MAGTITADTLTHSTAGSVTTNNLVKGTKQWCRWNQTGTAAISESFNTSSLTDLGTGLGRLTYTNSMNTSTYAVGTAIGELNGGGNRGIGMNGNGGRPTTSSADYYQWNTSWAGQDQTNCNATITGGDLA